MNFIIKCVFVFMLLIPAAFANSLVITEVLYDPLLTESGGEAIELYNPANTTISLQDYMIQTQSFKNYTLPAINLAPDTYFLVADTNWSLSKDNETFANADYEVSLSLTNTDSGVRIVNIISGDVSDIVGWGHPNVGFYEQTPAKPAPPGYSLQRTQDTNNNSKDFMAAYPDFKNSTKLISHKTVAEIIVRANISNSQPQITSIYLLEDDSSSEGVQLLPSPGGKRALTITAEVEDNDGEEDIQDLVAFIAELNISQQLSRISNLTYKTEIQLDYYLQPKNYTVEIMVVDKANQTAVSYINFEYLEIASLSLDSEEIGFANLVKGEYSVVLGDRNAETQEPTIINTGNSNLNLGVYGEDLAQGEDSIPISNMEYSFDNDFESSLSGQLSTMLQIVSLDLNYGNSALRELALRLFVPDGISSGEYEGKVSIVGVAQ